MAPAWQSEEKETNQSPLRREKLNQELCEQLPQAPAAMPSLP
ncbi:hypothetical protein LEMLEM_LOCUS2812 [Lemmus lemmus]